MAAKKKPKAKRPMFQVDAAAASQWTPIEELVPWDKNPRRNEHKIGEAKSSLRRFGFAAPIVVWREMMEISAGHTRLKAMISLLEEDPGLDGLGGKDAKLAKKNAKLRASLVGPTLRHLPVRFMHFENAAEAHAYALRDNNSIGAWDEDLVGRALAEIKGAGSRVAGLGFSDKEIDKLLASAEKESSNALRTIDPALLQPRFVVLVECKTERQQTSLLRRFAKEGLEVRALVQ